MVNNFTGPKDFGLLVLACISRGTLEFTVTLSTERVGQWPTGGCANAGLTSILVVSIL
uniref:Uncharacterized protein n=1 Tax=Rhizophora mucronata TaxID=61149 RepID=A0A2P2PWV9_RHIMU